MILGCFGHVAHCAVTTFLFVYFLCWISFLFPFFFLLSNKHTRYALSTEKNTFSRKNVCTRAKIGGSQTVKHVPRTHTHIYT